MKKLASLIIVISLLWTARPVSAQKVGSNKPNVIFILVDTLRADYLGCYGFDGAVSPHMDFFSDESIRFEQAIAPAPWTKPSIASIFTSLHPQTHRVTDHLGMHWKKVSNKVKSSVLSDEAVTLAEVLKANGYDTLGFVGNDFLIRRFGYHQGFSRYYEPRPHTDVFSATPLFNKALRLLKKGKIKEPYFLYFHFMDVHGPYQCNGKDFEAVKKSKSLGKNIYLTQKQRRKIPSELTRNVRWRGQERGRNVRSWRNCYAAGIRKYDRRFGAFMKKLRAYDDLSNTIFIITSDHGEELYDHFKWAHSHTLYSELLRVPLIVRLPGGRNGGTVVKQTVSLIDLMPTILNQVGAKNQPSEMAGQDLSSLLEGGEIGFLRNAYATSTRHEPGMISSQSNSSKIIWNFPNGKPLMFDLINDPNEKRNISKKSYQQLEGLKRDVQLHLRSLEQKRKLLEQSTELDPELIERLKALGYVQ